MQMGCNQNANMMKIRCKQDDADYETRLVAGYPTGRRPLFRATPCGLARARKAIAQSV